MKNPKTSLLIIILIIIAIIGILLGSNTSKNSSQELLNQEPTNSKSSANDPFPLDDSSAIYTIEKLGTDFMVTYQKNNESTSAFIGKSNVNLSSFIDKTVSVEGEFRTEKQEVQCFKAPCDPVEETVLDILDLTLLSDI